MKRFERLEQIRTTDPEKEATEIYRLTVAYEFLRIRVLGRQRVTTDRHET